MKKYEKLSIFFFYYFPTESYRIINTFSRGRKFKIYTKILFRKQIFQKELNFY